LTDEQQGIVAGISSKVIQALPGTMLLVLLLNIAFIGALFYLLLQQNSSRERALIPLLAACVKTVPLEAFPYGLMPAPKP